MQEKGKEEQLDMERINYVDLCVLAIGIILHLFVGNSIEFLYSCIEMKIISIFWNWLRALRSPQRFLTTRFDDANEENCRHGIILI